MRLATWQGRNLNSRLTAERIDALSRLLDPCNIMGPLESKENGPAADMFSKVKLSSIARNNADLKS